MDEGRQEMATALFELQQRISKWMEEGNKLQQQLINVTLAVMIDTRPLTKKEQEWARKIAGERR